MSRSHRIAVIPGDGIGRETVEAGVQVLERVAARWDFGLEMETLPWGCDHYTRTGAMMDPDGIDRLRNFDAILLGAVGDPSLPDDLTLWGLMIPIRRAFRQYVNLRPIRLFKGVDGPLKGRGPDDIDLVIVRENNEGEYSDVGGRIYESMPEEVALQVAAFTRHGTERVMRFALDLARSRDKVLASATKSNGIRYTMPFWDETLQRLIGEAPDVELSEYHVDALAAMLVRDPARFDVIVGSNLFGDILSDLAGALAGSLGLAPSANLNPERDYPSMFEPVHGSAPDISGRGIANPIGQIWSAAMMLEHLGESAAATGIVTAIERMLAETDVRTPDLGGTAATSAVTETVIAMLGD